MGAKQEKNLGERYLYARRAVSLLSDAKEGDRTLERKPGLMNGRVKKKPQKKNQPKLCGKSTYGDKG